MYCIKLYCVRYNFRFNIYLSCGILRLSKFKRDKKNFFFEIKKKQKVIGENPNYKVVLAELINIILNA